MPGPVPIAAARKGRCRCKQLGQDCTEDRNCCAQVGKPVTCQQGTCATVSSGPPRTPCSGLKPTDDLQAAIDAAAAGSTLTLCPGTWRLSAPVLIAKNLTLIFKLTF